MTEVDYYKLFIKDVFRKYELMAEHEDFLLFKKIMFHMS